MKSIIISIAIAAIAFSACNNSTNKSADVPTVKNNSDAAPAAEQVYACSMHPEVTGKKGDKCSKCGMELTEVKKDTAPTTTPPVSTDAKAAVSIKKIVSAYLQLKNAFTKDNTNDATAAGTSLENVFKAFDKKTLTADQKKTFEDVEDDAREHAEHIGKNGGNIKHQREHFEMLSKDVYDLVKAFGIGQVLYKDFCPMYNNNNGAFWISETKEIKNPYLGKAMPTCGIVKEEIK